MCIGGAFELAICITTGSAWLSFKLNQINQLRLEADEAEQEAEIVKAPVESPPRASNTSIVIYTFDNKTYFNPYPKVMNLRRFIIDSNKSADEITIKKIKHDMKLKEYATMFIVDSIIQYYLQKSIQNENIPTCLLVTTLFLTSILLYK